MGVIKTISWLIYLLEETNWLKWCDKVIPKAFIFNIYMSIKVLSKNDRTETEHGPAEQNWLF